MVEVSNLWLGFGCGVLLSGVIRLTIGRFIIYTRERGWVWEWSRWDEEDQRIRDRLDASWHTGYSAAVHDYNMAQHEGRKWP